jgi:four helix bundle protein
MDLATDVYSLTRRFPRAELFGITAQLRKAAVSISSNIAEGSGRATTKDLLNFLATARGSLRETESLLILSRRLDYLTAADLKRISNTIHEIGRMLTTLRSRLKARAARKQTKRA